ncbi:hypothetical protein M9H77_04544 [Catharanthus roseus]|uniref:Uncharacterized protein n=1 Tax=Catharanthus roseus TaxID=4058 RepID=A0ACC0CEE1_CATRO|nr:hypothetical protein M9H77_04544 [Catharanthus roseus]
MTPTDKNFTVATAFMRNEQATTYRWVLQQIKHLYYLSAVSTGNEQDSRAHEPVWTSQVLHFGVETTNSVESEHSVLKLWLSTCHGDLDTVFLNIDSLIEGHLALKKIWVEIKRAPEIIVDPKNKCGLYLRTSHGLRCSCELITWFEHVLPIQLDDIEAFWRTLEIDGFSCSQEKDMDMDSEIRALADLLDQISTGPISKLQKDDGRRTQQNGTSRIGSTCQLLMERYKSQAVPIRVLALDPVWVPIRVWVPVGWERQTATSA